MRLSRVADDLASLIHSTYSRRWLGGKLWKAASAFGNFLSIAWKYGGTFTGGFGGFLSRATLTPSSFNFFAALTIFTIAA